MGWQFPEQSILLLPAQRIRLSCRPLLHLDKRRGTEPRHAVVVPPDPGGQVQYPPDAGEFLVDGAGRDPVRATSLPVFRQRIVVNAIQSQIADMRNDPIEGIHIAIQTFLALIVIQVLDRGLLKRPCRSNAVNDGPANLFQAVRQIPLRLCEIARATAFCHSSVSLDLLVDPPDAASLLEAR
jgi:hypothetical protein